MRMLTMMEDWFVDTCTSQRIFFLCFYEGLVRLFWMLQTRYFGAVTKTALTL